MAELTTNNWYLCHRRRHHQHQHQHQHHQFPVLGLLQPVTGIIWQNPSVVSKAFLNFFLLLVHTLTSFGGSYLHSSLPHALSSFFCILLQILLLVECVMLSKFLCYLCGLRWCILQPSSCRHFTDTSLLSSFLLIVVHASPPYDSAGPARVL